MFKQVAIFVLFLSLLGCGHEPTVSIEDQYKPYTDAFVRYSIIVGKPTGIYDLIMYTVPEIGGAVMGQCTKYDNATPRIIISYKFWKLMDTTKKEMLVLHELGHCVLNRSHNNATDQYGQPVSLMHWSNFDENIYLNAKMAFLYELFNP